MSILLALLACPRSGPPPSAPPSPPSPVPAPGAPPSVPVAPSQGPAEARALLERAARARWEWAASIVRAEMGEDLPDWHRASEARFLIERACDLGDLSACLDAGEYEKACRAKDAASCARAEAVLRARDENAWLLQRCAEGDGGACREIHGGRSGVELELLPMPPGGMPFYLSEGSLVAFTERGPAVLGEGGWQHPRPVGFQLPELRVTPVDEGLVLPLPHPKGSDSALVYLRHGPEGSVTESVQPPAGLKFCRGGSWNSQGIQLARMIGASRPESDCWNDQAEVTLAALEAKGGALTELTALTEALPSKFETVAIARGWVAAASGTQVARARLERVDGRLVLGPVEVRDLPGVSLAVSDTGAVAVSDRKRLFVWTDTVTELPAEGSPRFAGSRLFTWARGKVFVWDLAAGPGWASQRLTLNHLWEIKLAPSGRELVAKDNAQRLVRVRLVPEAPERLPPAPSWWTSLQIPVLPEQLPPAPSPGKGSKAKAPSGDPCAPKPGNARWGFAFTVVDERGTPVPDARVWVHQPFEAPRPLLPTSAGTFCWLVPWQDTWREGRIVAEHPDGRWAFVQRKTDQFHRLSLVLSSAPRFVARVTDASGAPVAGATLLWGSSKEEVGVTGPDGTWHSLRFNPGEKIPLSVRVNGVLQNVHLQPGPVLEARILPPVWLEAEPGDQTSFVLDGTPHRVKPEITLQGGRQATFPAPGQWTAYRVRDGKLFRATVTIGAEAALAPDWVAVPVRPLRVVDSQGVPLPGLRVELALVDGAFKEIMPAVTDLDGVVGVPTLPEVGWSFEHISDTDEVQLLAPDALPEEITFLSLGERYRKMLALGHGVKVRPSGFQQYEVVSVEPGAVWDKLLAPGHLLPEHPDELWAQAQKSYPLASVQVTLRGPKRDSLYLPGGPRCCAIRTDSLCSYPRRELRYNDPFRIGPSSSAPPYLCVLPPHPPAPLSPPPDLAKAIEGQWVEVHPAAERSAKNAGQIKVMYEADMRSQGAILYFFSKPEDRAEAAWWLKAYPKLPEVPAPSAPMTLQGEPGIGWWVLERGEHGPEQAVIPVNETYAVRWSRDGYQLLERR